jgi:hypothetical protein
MFCAVRNRLAVCFLIEEEGLTTAGSEGHEWCVGGGKQGRTADEGCQSIWLHAWHTTVELQTELHCRYFVAGANCSDVLLQPLGATELPAVAAPA